MSETEGTDALEPISLKDVMKKGDWPLFKKAIEEELAILKGARTWELIDAPSGVHLNVVGCYVVGIQGQEG